MLVLFFSMTFKFNFNTLSIVNQSKIIFSITFKTIIVKVNKIIVYDNL